MCTYANIQEGALQRDIQSLQEQNNDLDVIVASIRHLPESEAMSIMHSIRSESSLGDVAASLRTNIRLPSGLGPQTLEAEFAEQLRTTPTSSRADSRGSLLSRENSDDNRQQASTATSEGGHARWSSMPRDLAFVEHLLNSYFCWIHPFYHLLSRDLYLYDFTEQSWQPCADDNVPVNATMEDAPRSTLLLESLTKLSELASSVVGSFYASQQERFTSGRLASAYTHYQDWYNQLPPELRLDSGCLANVNVIVLHMYYHGFILQ